MEKASKFTKWQRFQNFKMMAKWFMMVGVLDGALPPGEMVAMLDLEHF